VLWIHHFYDNEEKWVKLFKSEHFLSQFGDCKFILLTTVTDVAGRKSVLQDLTKTNRDCVANTILHVKFRELK
jgi:hypothetical protein